MREERLIAVLESIDQSLRVLAKRPATDPEPEPEPLSASRVADRLRGIADRRGGVAQEGFIERLPRQERPFLDEAILIAEADGEIVRRRDRWLSAERAGLEDNLL